jgi:hypothetical protein
VSEDDYRDSSIEPVVTVGVGLTGVTVSAVPETQYEYCRSPGLTVKSEPAGV